MVSTSYSAPLCSASGADEFSAGGSAALSLCCLVVEDFLGYCIGNWSCGGTSVEAAADLESPLLGFPYLLHCCPLWAVFGEEGPCGMVASNPDTCSVPLVYLALLNPGCQPPLSHLPAQEGWNIVVDAQRVSAGSRVGTVACGGAGTVGPGLREHCPIPHSFSHSHCSGHSVVIAWSTPAVWVVNLGSGLLCIDFLHWNSSRFCNVCWLHTWLSSIISNSTVHLLRCEDSSWGYLRQSGRQINTSSLVSFLLMKSYPFLTFSHFTVPETFLVRTFLTLQRWGHPGCSSVGRCRWHQAWCGQCQGWERQGAGSQPCCLWLQWWCLGLAVEAVAPSGCHGN